MTFFYDLNKKLDGIREKPETTHQQLNERDMSRAAKGYEKYGKEGMEALAKAGREGKDLDKVRDKYNKYDDKKDVEEGLFGDAASAAKSGFGKIGNILKGGAKRALDVVAPGDEELLRGLQKSVGVPQTGKKPGADAPVFKTPKSHEGFPRMSGGAPVPALPKSHEGFPRVSGGGAYTGKGIPGAASTPVRETVAPIDFDKVLDAIAALYGDDIWENDAMQALANDLEQAGPTDRELDFIIAKGKLPKRLAGIQFSAGDDVQFGESAATMTPKQKSFAALAEPKDKITFADKIAGAKKEVDEMLGDVAAEAMKKAIGGHGEEMDEAGYSAKAARAGKDIGKPGKQFSKIAKSAGERYGSKERGEKVAGAVLAKLRKGGVEEASDDNSPFTAHKRPRVDQPAKGSVEHGRKHDIKHDTTDPRYSGRIVTRRTDPSGISVGADDEAAQSGEARGRGRPKKAGGPAQERVTAKSRKADRTTYQSKKKATEGADDPAEQGEYDREGDMALDDIDTIQSAAQELQGIIDADENLPEWVQSKINKAMDYLDTARDYMAAQGNDEQQPVTEKAVSKKQQRFMGMVHAAQKGKKPASKAVATVAKEMPKKEAEKFASTKHKGLPEKKKPEGKKKEKTEEAGGTGTPTASSGFSYGKGIYDSINHELESMIAESMSVNMSMNSDGHGGPSKSLTVTATDEDAVYLGKLLKMAGLGQGDCGCGTSPCSCQQMDEAYGDTEATQNAPDYPTNTETSNNALQYSGGLNKPKSTGQTTVPVIASQEERQMTYESDLARMMEIAGAKVGDMIDYVSPAGEQPPEDLIMQSGVQYDPDTNVISVPNSTQMANTHRAIEAAGWKKQTAGARPNPMAGQQAQVAGDTPYQLGEEDDLARMMEMAGQPASGMGAQVGDMIDYVSPSGEQPSEELIMQSGVQYDPDTNVISVPNSTQMASTHRAIEAAGWKKQTAGARPNPMAGRQAQVAGDVPYQLGEEDELARMMEMAGIKESDRKDFFHNPDLPDDEQLPAPPEEIHVPGMDEEADDDNEKLPAPPEEIYVPGMDEELKRIREMAGIKTEVKKVEEDDVEEGNRFTYNLKKAREQGKKEADLDGDGDMEKVRESIFDLTSQWKAYKG